MIIRNVDTAGRIIIPSEMLHELDLHKLDKVVITLEGNYIKPVSYTHLDVYKRQVPHGTERWSGRRR